MNNYSQKINIVLLTDCLADLMGGAERQIYELAKGLDKDKFGITVASLECVGQAPRPLIEEIGCRFIDFRVKRIYGLSGLIQGIRFWRFLKHEKIHILQTYHFSSDIWGTCLAHWAGVKMIISSRRDMGFWRTRRHVAAYKWINHWVHKIVAVSESVKHLVMSEEGVPEEKIEVIYNGIHLSLNNGTPIKIPARQDMGVQEDDVVMMHVANLTPVKGHAYLLRAMARLLPECPKAKLVLVGEGPLRAELTDLVKQLGIGDRVSFLGKREDARQLLDQADLCVLPSLSEGMSNAILEYMAAGKAVVATSVGGNPELVDDGQTGLLVDKESVEQLASALLTLASVPEKRHEMGSKGFTKAKEKFTMASMISAHDGLYGNFFKKRPARILHLVSSAGLYGAERVILNLAQDGGAISYVGALYNCHNPHLEIIDEAKKLGLKTAVFNSRGPIDFKTIFKIKKFLRDNQIDILHTHNYKSDIVGFLAILLSKSKWVATNHVWHGLDRKLRLYETIDAFVLRFAAQIMAVSSEIKEDLVAKNIPQEKVQVIDNGIDISRFSRPQSVEKLKEDLGIRQDDVVVTIVGRLSPEKGHRIFLKAAREVSSDKENVKFLIVGDGPIKEELHAEVTKLNLGGRVIFTGIRKDMPQIYALSHLMVNASSIEGLPMTILEAMASKVPVIATRTGGIPGIIKDNETGLLVDAQDADALKIKIESLINDRGKRWQLAASAFEFVKKNCSLGRMCDAYRQVYGEVMGEQ